MGEATARKLAREGLGWVKVSRGAGITRAEAERIIHQERALLALVQPKVEPEVMERGVIESPPVILPVDRVPGRKYFERAADAFFDLLGRQRPAFMPMGGEVKGERYAIFSDIHAPWHQSEKLIQACNEAEAAGCETLIVSGDLFEFHRISSHHKSKTCTFEEELAGCRLAAEYLASRFKRCLYFKGNHDDRWQRYVGDNVAEEIRFAVPDIVALTLDGLGFQDIGHRVEIEGEGKEKSVHWLAQIGTDAIITHCQASSSQQGVNVEKLKQWLFEWGAVLGLNPNARFIATGHTHRGTMLHEQNRLLVELGFLASWDVQDYQYSAPGGAQLRNRKPGTHGWTLLVQENGVTNLKESGFRRLIE